MFALNIVLAVVVFVVAVFGLGAALAPTHIGDPLRRLCAGAALAIGAQFVVGFLAFAAGYSNRVVACTIAVVALVSIAVRGSAIRVLFTDASVRSFFMGWLVFAAWTLGLLALVVTYSGGGWVVDWAEHWQRTLFFLDRQPLNTHFAIIYSLTARPPLANLVIALWLEVTGASFAHYQVFMALMGSLVLLPAWILIRQWTVRNREIGWLLLVLMLSPFVAQNLTFTWTKLPTAFFVLAALAYACGDNNSRENVGLHRLLAAACLGLGVLTHYSAGPWAIAIACGSLAAAGSATCTPIYWRDRMPSISLFTLVILVWAIWAVAEYGVRGVTGSTTTAEAWRTQSTIQRTLVPIENLFDTIVPFPLRGEPQDGLITQSSKLGRLRDVAFSLYQLNIMLSAGISGLWIIASTAAGRWQRGRMPEVRRNHRRFWWVTLLVAFVLGVAVHTPRDEWGLVHICLQPLVILALAGVATALSCANAQTRVVWVLLAVVDFSAGIVLHFGLQSWALARYVAPGETESFLKYLSGSAVVNARDKAGLHLEFVSDRLHVNQAMVVLLLALCIAYGIFRTKRSTV